MSIDKLKKTEKNNSFPELVTSFAGKPAFWAAMVLIATLAALDNPYYAPFLLIPLGCITLVLEKFLQRIALVFLLVGVACHLICSSTKAPSAVFVPGERACGIVESVLPRNNGMAFIVQVKSEKSGGGISETYRVRLTEKRLLAMMPEPGDSLCYEVSWYSVEPPTVPGTFDTQKWLDSQDLAAYGKVKQWDCWKGKWTLERSFFHFRNWVKNRFSRYLDSAETGLLMGLLAGDRSGIPELLRSDFQRSGLVHVLAISGFHVVLLAGLLMTFLKATGMPHKIVRIIGVVLLIAYVPVTGGSPAVRRAVMMFAIPQIGMLLQRPANAMNSLGVSLILILLPNPQVLWNPGFQLSVAATLGIILGSSRGFLNNLPEALRKNGFWNRFQAFVLEPTYVTFCATLATAPFLIHHFKTLSPLAWLGNIVIVPLISWGMEAGLFALLSPLDLLTEIFCSAASFLLRAASYFTHLLSDSTLASVTVGPYPPFVLLAMGLFFALLPSTRKNRLRGILLSSALLFFSCYLFVCNYEKVVNPYWKLSAIDVGQGDAILLTTPSGKNILIDSGPNEYRDAGKDIIVPYLRHLGILSLDAVVVTHADADHFGGVLGIIKSIPVKELWVSECARLELKPAWMKTMAVALEREIPLRDIGRGFIWSDNSFEMLALHPISTSRCGETNEESVTFRVKGLGHSAILTGDLTVAGERKILSSGMFLNSDVLKLGHHGSKTSSSRNFLMAVRPKLALVSSGRRNRFRHPHKQVTERLDSLGVPYLNTANSGTISVKFTADTMLVQTALEQK